MSCQGRVRRGFATGPHNHAVTLFLNLRARVTPYNPLITDAPTVLPVLLMAASGWIQDIRCQSDAHEVNNTRGSGNQVNVVLENHANTGSGFVFENSACRRGELGDSPRRLAERKDAEFEHTLLIPS